ncbi:MAG: oxygen-independent coproporphyrinogen III oxidase [Burkholderiales bacterium]|nr:oxygen-independent coproporphyrinogen III oxidase [Burkholderiales bacterium]MDE2288446.1 oxygen-independent coproporphyrinogen III oxidase [Burkholderiales bacterium]
MPNPSEALSVDDLFDPALLRKYDLNGPRYTSYPTAPQFHDRFGAAEYRQAAAQNRQSGQPLSLYMHLPFCDTVCFYCACNKVITRNRARTRPYLDRLYREIAAQAALFDGARRPIAQLHWGGGTPTFLSHDEMSELMAVTGAHFQLLGDDQGEYSIEVDPREASPDTIALLRELGFNRLSVGVQDFDPQVQRAVNRIQPRAVTEATVNAARQTGFRSISLDLIYGLPHQSVASFSRTLDAVLELAPDRLSVFNYAHLPQFFKMQQQIDESALPGPAEKLAILKTSIERLGEAGYVYIGMDHFARPDDELAQAQVNRTLYRNFQGYSTHADCDLIGLGVSAIGKIGNFYAQNLKVLPDYQNAIDAEGLAVTRGIMLNDDDLLRRAVINQLMCHFELPLEPLETQFGIDPADYFRDEFERLRAFEADGLLTIEPDRLRVLPAGRLLVRNICMVFDRYLAAQPAQRFSKTL